MDAVRVVILFLSACAFGYGVKLFIEASQPCGGDGCLIHVLYIIAIPVMIVSGIIFYRSAKKLFGKSKDES